jgi:predicted DNA-binding ribbon-helix-helix protein
MKSKSQPTFLLKRPIKIEDIWEVHLARRQWNRIQQVAKRRQCTYSQVTRFCAFKLAQKPNLRNNLRVQQKLRMSAAHTSSSASFHRHMVCFYGEDLKLIRIAAIELGVTVSAFIRLSLKMYLAQLEMEIHNGCQIGEREFFWGSIKRWLVVPLNEVNMFNLPTMRRYLFSGFPPQLWWGPDAFG